MNGMEFFPQWQSQIDHSLREFARLAAAADELDVRYGWLATALLWPIRASIQDFDSEAMDAVREITGRQTKHILKAVQEWDDDPTAAARALADMAKDSPEIALALSALINRFDAAAAFSGHLAQVLVQQRGGGDVYNLSEQIKAALVNIGGVTNIQSLEVTVSLVEPPPPVTRERRNELALLHKVRTFWVEGVLERSLHGMAMLELGMQEAVGIVDQPHPWEMVLDLPDRLGEDALPPSTRLIEVFDGLEKTGDCTLLILGEPGAGKTITLLELARDSMARAEREAGHPLPVVFNLSAWGEKQLPLAKWLVEELNQKYQIPRKIAQAWLDDQALLLLLDGLDEVRAELRPACVEAVNAFRQEHGLTPIVVCSRVQEYEALRRQLRFQRALRIQPLDPEQVDAYLQATAGPLTSLRLALEQDETLRELARSPLMLNIMSLAYRDVPAETLLSSELQPVDARRRHLFGTYVRRMFERRGARDTYTSTQAVGWLSWLAQNMALHSQSVFLLENLQPNWLTPGRERWMYFFASRLLGVFGTSSGFIIYVIPVMINRIKWIFGTQSLLPESDVLERMLLWLGPDLFVTLTVIIGLGLVIGVVDGLWASGVDSIWSRGQRYTDQTVEGRLLLLLLPISYFLIVGFIVIVGFIAVSIGLIVTEIIAFEVRFGALENVINIMVFITIPFALIFGLRGRRIFLRKDIHTRETLNYSWHRSRRILVFASILPGVLIFFVTQVLYSQDSKTGVLLWNADTGEQVNALAGENSVAAFSPDGSRLVTGGRGGTARLWDWQTEDLIALLRGHSLKVTYAEFGPDGLRLVTADADKTARLWDGQTGDLIAVLEGHKIANAEFSPDGLRLVTPSYSITGESYRRSGMLGWKKITYSVDVHKEATFSPDGMRLAKISSGPGRSFVQLWDGRTGELINILEGAGLWDGRTGELVAVLEVRNATFSPDGTRMAILGQEGVGLWDGRTGELVAILEGYTGGWPDVAFSADGTRMAILGQEGVGLWDGQTGELITHSAEELPDPISIAFSPDGARLVTSNGYGTVRFWDGDTGELVTPLTWEGDWGLLTTATFSPDGLRLATAANVHQTQYGDGTARLWDGRTGELIAVLEVGDVTFSPDSLRLVTFSELDKKASLWDGHSGDLLAIMAGHSGLIHTAAFNPNGQVLLTAQNITDYRGWTFVALIGLFFGFFVGFQTRVIETKTRPNQGIHLTVRNALLVALFFGGLAFIVSVFLRIIYIPLIDGFAILRPGASIFGVTDVERLIMAITIPIALLVFLVYGGLDVIYHYVLRFLLVLRSHTPWRYTRFLDYAVERIFLQKVGGGYYIFIHRLLLEYFASLDETERAALAGAITSPRL
jgi:WD40 repeat protein